MPSRGELELPYNPPTPTCGCDRAKRCAARLEKHKVIGYSSTVPDREKPINISILGGRDKQKPSLGETGPLPGQIGTCPSDKPAVFQMNSTVKSSFCPFVAGTGGFVPGTIVPQGPSENLLFIGSFWPPILGGTIGGSQFSTTKARDLDNRPKPRLRIQRGMNLGTALMVGIGELGDL